MRVAWFHPASPDEEDDADDVRLLVDELRAVHEIDIVDEAGAHDFVWRHARRPYDLCVYDLADTTAHQYMWPYLLHAPGVVALRARSLANSRGEVLARERRGDDYRAELAFGGRPMLRAPLAAARLVVVFDAAVARDLKDDYPGVRIEVAQIGVRGAGVRGAQVPGARVPGAKVRFGVVEASDPGLVERAARRARSAGAQFGLMPNRPLDDTIRHADVVIALRWPPDGAPLTRALVAMASARPCIVLETEVSAAWPALDPQTWLPRDPRSAAAPVVVSLDPRDEEHSLVLALRRLSADAALRDALGRAAHAWWRDHATVGHAAAAWRGILDRTVRLDAPPHPPGWPAHLTADGTERARAILRDFGVSVDFLKP